MTARWWAGVVVMGGGVLGTGIARTGPDGIVFCNSVGPGVRVAVVAWDVVDGARGEWR